MLRLFMLISLVLTAPAQASTWPDNADIDLRTPITVEEKSVFEAALKCAKTYENDEYLAYYQNTKTYAVFGVTKDNKVQRFWNAAAERVAIDLCQSIWE